MALDNNFYQEIYINEQKWIGLIESNLLNIYYFNVELVPFYKKKLEELIYEYNLTENKIIEQIIEEVKCIIQKLEEFDAAYRMGNLISTKSLIPLFLVSKFNNNGQKAEVPELDRLEIRKQVLTAIRDHYTEKKREKLEYNYSKKENEQDDYLYEDFPVR
ncbi:MAG: hypothetical protein IKL65_03840 [Bacilli bacterium]|nr:hypothetical protein [Bacilli bacterium]